MLFFLGFFFLRLFGGFLFLVFFLNGGFGFLRLALCFHLRIVLGLLLHLLGDNAGGIDLSLHLLRCRRYERRAFRIFGDDFIVFVTFQHGSFGEAIEEVDVACIEGKLDDGAKLNARTGGDLRNHLRGRVDDGRLFALIIYIAVDLHLGAEMQIYCDVDYQSEKTTIVDAAAQMVAKISSRASVELGSVVELAFDARHIHLFDGFTEATMLERDEHYEVIPENAEGAAFVPPTPQEMQAQIDAARVVTKEMKKQAKHDAKMEAKRKAQEAEAAVQEEHKEEEPAEEPKEEEPKEE